MLYPLSIEIKLIQEDFIEVEIIENILDGMALKKETLGAYILQTLVLLGISIIFFITSWIARESLYFTLFFWVLFTANFIYRYFIGIKNELKLTLGHLIVSNQKGNNFFTEEIGFANFFEESIEFLTNEQRRYFDYSLISNIKLTKRLVIFIMRGSKEKGLRGFSYMIIPKRDMSEEQSVSLLELCEEIKVKYSLKEWIGKTLFD